ncbi:MAG TPA: YbhB/YbcL family Raf kinase inhibitor-like protein [Burkholderiales bacterium]|nr:YbhB/YbcL family Raf kinase inhibitor-like protein [Burkholderiales bacterium]
MSMTIGSKAFSPNSPIPVEYTCQGEDKSPPLEWTNVPAAAESLALIVDDPDAPNPASPRMTWVHWVLYNIPANAKGLTTAIRPNELPRGTLQGKNDWGRTGYGGPCPPIGRHRYFFKLYALDRVLPDLKAPTKAQLLEAMKGHVLEEAQLIGTYEKAS